MQVSLPPFEFGSEFGPAKAEFAQWVAATKNKVGGKIVMIGKAAGLPVDFTPGAKRLPDDRVKADFDPPKPGAKMTFKLPPRSYTVARLTTA